MNKIKSIAFDLEGTVVDVESAHHNAHILSASDVGVTLSFEDCLKKLPHFIGGPDDKVAQEIAELANSQYERRVEYREIHESKRAHYDNLLKEMVVEPRKGFLGFLHEIKRAKIKYAIGSLTNQEQALVLLEKGGLIELFGMENIVLAEHVTNRKPAPDVWIETAKRTAVEPASQIVFEDSPRGIQGAMKVGAYCIGMPAYNRPDTINALVNAGAKRVFLQWDEINPDNLLYNINKEHDIQS